MGNVFATPTISCRGGIASIRLPVGFRYAGIGHAVEYAAPDGFTADIWARIEKVDKLGVVEKCDCEDCRRALGNP